MAQYLLENPSLVENKKTIELGAGCALPSLVALSLRSTLSVLTDYPNEQVLQSLRHTVGFNWNSCNGSPSRVLVAGHAWGEDLNPIFQAVENRMMTLNVDDSTPYFHVLLLSECIWNHSLHEKLATSVDSLLHPTEGVAIVTYAHHIPGKEREDDAFFQLCHDKYHFVTEHVSTQSMEYMWDCSKNIDIYLKVMKRGIGMS